MPIFSLAGNQLNSFYSLEGDELGQAYNADGAELINAFDGLSDSGYTFTSGAETTATKLLFNFGTTSFQSVVYSAEKGRYYRASADNKVYPYDSNLQAMSAITLPSTGGHKNDGCYYNGCIYWLDGTASDPHSLYVWNIDENTVTQVSLPIENNENGSIRVVAGICNASADGTMYLVSRDQYNGSDIDHQEGDKLCIYNYDANSNTASLVTSYPWDCVYVQGATYVNGLLYVSCNTQTTGSASNYTGITIKVIDPVSGQLLKEMVCSGSFEPQGCDHIAFSSGFAYIWTGLSKYNTTDKVITFLAF